MQNRLAYFILFLVGLTSILYTSCSKNMSKDDPLSSVYSPSVFISSQNAFIYALNPVSSVKKWEFHASSNVQSTPVVYKDFLFVAEEAGNIYKLSLKTGKALDTFILGGQILATPVIEKDTLYVGASGTMYAIDVNSGITAWSKNIGSNLYSSPTVFDTLLIYGCYDGNVYATDRVDGSSVWTYASPSAGNQFYSSPVVSGNYVYIGGLNDGVMYCLNVFSGNLKWGYPTGGGIQSSPIVYGGNVIFGSNDYNLYCIDTASGFPRWAPINLHDRIVSSPYAYNQLIYVGSYDYNMYAVNIIDGTIKWQFKTGAIIKSSPMVYDSKLYFGSHDKFLYCLDPVNGDIKWKQNINGLIECSPSADNMDGKPSHIASISGNSVY